MSVGVLILTLVANPVAGWAADQPDRALPDYDGRDDPPPTAGEALIWVPRVIFYPAYLATEYLVRWPLGKFITWLERDKIFERAARIFTFGTGGDVGLVPTAFVDFGFRPSIGLYFWASEVFSQRDFFSLHFAWGGEDWWRVSVRERLSLEPVDEEGELLREGGVERQVALHFLLDYRPDHLFHGIGPQSSGLPTRFSWNQLGGSAAFWWRFGELDGIRVDVETRRNEIGNGDPDRSDGEVAIRDAFDDDELPGIDGYVLGRTGVELFLDSRVERPGPGTGARIEAFADLASDLRDTETSYLQYGGEVALFLDVAGLNRTLSVRQFVGLTETLGANPAPFPELYTLGGVELMRGFLEGRYRGESAFVTTLRYGYPIWVFLEGGLFIDMGNVFGPNLEGFDIEKMALSFGFSVRSNSERDAAFELLVGAGTSRFEAPDFAIDNVRVLFGTTRGF